MRELNKDNLVTLRLDDDELDLVTKYSDLYFAGSKGSFLRFCAGLVPQYIRKWDRKLKHSSKMILENREERREHQAILNKGVYILRKNFFLDYIKQLYTQSIGMKNVSDIRKTEFVENLVEMGIHYKYRRKQVIDALREVGYKSKVVVKTVD